MLGVPHSNAFVKHQIQTWLCKQAKIIEGQLECQGSSDGRARSWFETQAGKAMGSIPIPGVGVKQKHFFGGPTFALNLLVT